MGRSDLIALAIVLGLPAAIWAFVALARYIVSAWRWDAAPVIAPPRPKVYVAGPMSAFWRAEYNREAFETVAKHLREFGFDPIIPHELDTESGIDLSRPPESFTREEKAAMMRRDLAAIDKCVAVLSIQGHVKSYGRTVERAYARFIGVPVYGSVERLVDCVKGAK